MVLKEYRGKNIGGLQRKKTEESNITKIRWKPDRNVFADINISSEWLRLVAKRVAIIKNVTVVEVREETSTDLCVNRYCDSSLKERF